MERTEEAGDEESGEWGSNQAAPVASEGPLLAGREIGLDILPGEHLQPPSVAVARQGHQVRPGVAATAIGAGGDREIAALDHPAVVAGELVLGISRANLTFHSPPIGCSKWATIASGPL